MDFKNRFKSLYKRKRLRLLLLLPLSLALTAVAEMFPRITEQVYSTGIYRHLSGGIARATGFLPFSLAQWVLLAAVSSVLGYIAMTVVKIKRTPKKRLKISALALLTLLCVFSVIVFGFTVFCGLNYHRMTFAETNGIFVRPSSAEELADMCFELVKSTNEAAGNVRRDGGGVAVHSFLSYYDMAKTAAASFSELKSEYPALSGYTPRAKPVLFSKALSLADLVGFYFPFTFEANVNVDVLDYKIPSAMTHELAHYKGYMREDEANFIAYLACRESKNEDFIYSGNMLALGYSLNALRGADPDAYLLAMESLSTLVAADFNANYWYWRQFEGPVAEVSGMVNDAYLRTNRQSDGTRSYGRMVDLLLADYRDRRDIS